MINVSFVLQKKGRRDDTIAMSVVSQHETFIKYRDGDRKGYYEFTLDHADTYQYVTDLLTTLVRDVDPFDYIQVMPCTGPSVLYPICDLDNDTLRDAILSQVHTALCGEVVYNRYE